jgi:hypothetical protein
MGEREPLQKFNSHELLLGSVLAKEEAMACSIASQYLFTLIHNPKRHSEGFPTLAYPFTPGILDGGRPVYRFNVNHVVEVDDPMEMFSIKCEDVIGSWPSFKARLIYSKQECRTVGGARSNIL